MWHEKLPDWAAWLSISIWIEERQFPLSEKEEVLQETSARHLCFRRFLPILTHFITDRRGYSKQSFLIHTAAIHVGFEATICTVISSKLRLPRLSASLKNSAIISYAVKQRNYTKSANELCARHVCWHHFLCSFCLPEDTDKPIQLVTRGWCLSCRSSLHARPASIRPQYCRV